MAFTKLNKTQIARLQQIRRQAEEDHAFMDTLASDKRDDYEDMSDRWKEGDNGQNAEVVCSALEEARDALETLKDGFGEIEGMDE